MMCRKSCNRAVTNAIKESEIPPLKRWLLNKWWVAIQMMGQAVEKGAK